MKHFFFATMQAAVSIGIMSLLLFALLTLMGCPEAQMMTSVITDEPPDTVPTTTVGEVKEPEKPEEQPKVDPESTEEPEEPELADPVTPEIETADILPPSAWVLDFPGPYRKHTPPESNPEDFVGQVCMPTEGDDYNNWAEADHVAPVSGVTVTITHGPRTGEQVTTNEGGYYHFREVVGDELYLRVEREHLEPKEVIVHRSHPTELQKLRPNEVFDAQHQERERPQNAPGTILVGLRWPDAVRFILKEELLPHDTLFIMGTKSPITRRGAYGVHEVALLNSPEDRGKLSYSTLAHELAHARQHAVAIMHGGNGIGGAWWAPEWENTPEGKDYAKAWKKDLEEIPPNLWIGPLDKSDYFEENLIENAAEFCSYFWGMGRWEKLKLKERTPNRYQWAEEWLNHE